MNSYFQFKQFIVHQDKTAMKVCTDASLFGAWVASKLEKEKILPQNILDIGCGTGLLSLMLAQKTTAMIDAVEINEDAFLQAKENIALSTWKESINIFNEDISEYTSQKKYDVIICNPPFFVNQLKTDNADRNAAMHATELSFSALSTAIKNSLSNDGVAAILLPHNIVNEFVEILKKDKLHLIEQLKISHSPSHPLFRSILLFALNEKQMINNSISIRDNNNEYSAEFKRLLSDYYLHL